MNICPIGFIVYLFYIILVEKVWIEYYFFKDFISFFKII